MKRLKSPRAKLPPEQENREGRFEGQGMMFKCKLFGMLNVPGPRGDDICQDAMIALKQQSLKNRKESGSHKQRIFLNLSVKGIRIIDEKTQKMEHGHPIHRISYISHDKEDKRTFGYIVSLQEGYRLFAFRTEKAAAVLTANLKALFQVVYQKYKTKRDAVENGCPPPASETEIEEGEEVKGNDAFYAVPDKVTLVESKRSQDALGAPAPAVANLLDWADVNEQLEEINQGMKRSDTAELLSGVDDLNFSAAIGDDTMPPEGLAENPGFSDPFQNDPFFRPDAFDAANEDRTLKSSASDSSIQHRTNPFLSAESSDPFAATQGASIAKSKSLELFSADQVNETRAPANTPDLFGSDPFRASTTDQVNTSNNMDDLFSLQTPSSAFRAQPAMSNEPAMQPMQPLQPPLADQVCLEPSRQGQASNDDPFSLLSGDIQGMKGAMPAGREVPAFNQPKPKSTPQGAPLRVSSGPTIPPQGFSANNPFFQQGQRPYGGMQPQGYPQVPPRVDLQGQGQNMVQGRPTSPFGMQPNPMMSGMGQSQWGNFGPNSVPRHQMSSGFGGGAQQPNMDGLYATVNKPQASNSGDLLGLGSGGPDLFGAAGAPKQQPVTQNSGKDPFGDLGFAFN